MAFVSTTAVAGNSQNCFSTSLWREIYNRRGIFLSLVSAFFFTLQNVLTRFIHPDVTVIEISFFYVVIQSIFVVPIMTYKNISPNVKSDTKLLALLSLRGVFGTLVWCLSFYSIRHISIGDATAIVFSSPVLVGILARVFLKEAFGKLDTLLVLVSVSGVVLITQPPIIFEGNEMDLLGTLAAVGACVSLSVSVIACRELCLLNVSNLVIVLYHGIVGTLCMAVVNSVTHGWVVPPCYSTRYFLVGGGILGFVAQCLLTYAFSIERTMLVTSAPAPTKFCLRTCPISFFSACHQTFWYCLEPF